MNTPSLKRYEKHLKATAEWCIRSTLKGKGGSCAYFSPILGWSNPYPETTGYLIPTLIKLGNLLEDNKYYKTAEKIGHWLLEIQNDNGSWNGLLHPTKKPKNSVFNTGQILKGMAALYKHNQKSIWEESGFRGALWLTNTINSKGLWPAGDYRSEVTPSYYTHVAWPMLEIWAINDETKIKNAAENHLNLVLKRINKNGAISNWGFEDDGTAFTHTIAYTVRGLQESARITQEYDRYEKPLENTINVVYRKSELANGKLDAKYDQNWRGLGNYTCLTGNVQLAICLALFEKNHNDLRLINAATKLIDYVLSVQSLKSPMRGINGAVPGSWPIWGKYMFLRYPNWSAKYLCDSIMIIMDRIKYELKENDSKK